MIEITWLGHGTYRMRLETGEVILVDPWIEGNPSYPKDHKLDRVDVILVSHGHFDHVHDVLPLSKKFSPAIVAIYETATWLESKGGDQHHRDEQGRHGDRRSHRGYDDARGAQLRDP